MSNVIQIGAQKKTCKEAGVGKVAHKFFLYGAVTGFLGSAIIGSLLLLMLNGYLKSNYTYHNLKLLHVYIQFYLFIATFIFGFLYQAAGKIFNTNLHASKHCPKLLFFSMLGVLLFFIYPDIIYSRILFVVPFIYLLYFLYQVFLSVRNETKWGQCLPAIFGACVFLMSAFINLANPLQSLLLLWGGCMAFIFTAGQQFIAGVFGGKKLNRESGMIFSAFYLLSNLSLVLFIYTLDSLYWNLFICFACISILVFIGFTQFQKILSFLAKDPLAIGMLFAFIWAFAGVYIGTNGSSSADRILHIWAIGWLLPIIILVSTRIMNNFSNKLILSNRTLFFIILLWQFVPSIRGILHLQYPFLEFVMLAVVAAVLLVWMTGIIRAYKFTVQL